MAALLLEMGENVSGCDIAMNAETQLLVTRGARIFSGHSDDHVQGVDRMIFTRASSGASELGCARELGIPTENRNALLGQLMDERRGVAVAGTHGKTTTTSLIATMLIHAGLDPTALVGGVPAGWQFGARHGRGEWLVAEADEFDRSFLFLHPEIAVVTGIDMDHPDIYPDVESLKTAFGEFLEGMQPGGNVVAYAGSERGMEVVTRAARTRELNVHTYGVGDADWRAVNAGYGDGYLVFDLLGPGEVVEGLRTRLLAGYNLQNVTAAIVTSRAASAPWESVRSALEEFRGVGRRFELKGAAGGVTVYDDYGHHPAEVEVTLKAARDLYPDLRVWVAFQPHTYSRTRELMAEFAAALRLADRAYILDVYAAREAPEPGITGERLAAETGPTAVYAGGVDDVAWRLGQELLPGTLLLTMGAGSITSLGPRVLDLLEVQART